MDFVSLIQQIGFPIACAVAVGWYAHKQSLQLKAAYEARITALEKVASSSMTKLDDLNEYIRKDLADIAQESHQRERELIRLLRDRGEHREASHRHLDPQPARPLSDEDTERLAVARKQERQDQRR